MSYMSRGMLDEDNSNSCDDYDKKIFPQVQQHLGATMLPLIFSFSFFALVIWFNLVQTFLT